MSTLKDRARQKKKGRTVLVRPLVAAWMLKHHDSPLSDSAIELAENILRRNDEVIRRGKNSPSQGNDCSRASVLKFMGYPDKPVDSFSTLSLFLDGNYGHLMWQIRMWDMGLLELAEFPVSVKDWGVAGTCDGILAIPDFKAAGGYHPSMTRQDVRDIVDSGDVNVTRLVLEIKRANDFRWGMMHSTGEPEPKVVWQGSLYYYGAVETLEDDSLKGTCYWIENKNTNAVVEFDLSPTDAGYAAIDSFYKDKVLAPLRLGKLPARPHQKGSKQCNSCWQKTNCERMEGKGKKRITPWKGVDLGRFAREVLDA